MADEQFAASLTSRIRRILSTADLDSISAKGVRKELASQGIDEACIKQNKSAIDAIIAAVFNGIRHELRTHSPPVAGPSNHAGSTYNPPTSPLIPLDRPGYGASVKRERSPQAVGPSPSKKPKLEADRPPPRSAPAPRPISDEAYARQLQAELDGAGRSSRGGTSSTGKAKKIGKSTKKKVKSEIRAGSPVDGAHGEHGSGEDKKKRGGGGGGAFNKPMLLSEPLQALIGEAQLSRPQTVKALWVHIKGHELQDPNDKRYILCDAAMRRVFGQDRVHMMTMNKELGRHLFNPDEIVG